LITADRNLTERAETLGVTVGRPGMLLERLDQLQAEQETVEASAEG
jgi:hypothetical protein